MSTSASRVEVKKPLGAQLETFGLRFDFGQFFERKKQHKGENPETSKDNKLVKPVC